MSHAAKLIKLGDKISNITEVLDRPAADWDETRRREYIEWGVQVVAGCRGTNAAMEQHFDALVARGRQELVG